MSALFVSCLVGFIEFAFQSVDDSSRCGLLYYGVEVILKYRDIGSIAEHGPISALKRYILVVVQDRDFVFHGSTQMSLSLDPLIGEYHWHPDIAAPLLAHAAQGRKHMRPRDHNTLAR